MKKTNKAIKKESVKSSKQTHQNGDKNFPFKILYENAPDAMILIDLKTAKIIDANKSAGTICQSDEMFLKGSDFLKLPPEHLWKDIKKFFRIHTRPKTRQQDGQLLETEILCSDGSIVPVEIAAHIVNVDDSPFLFCVIRNIEKRQIIESALRESETKYRNLVERANDGIAIIQDSYLQYANPSLIQMIGYRENDIIGHSFSKFLDPAERDIVIERYKRRLNGEKVEKVYETLINKKNGEQSAVEINSDLITFKGKPAVLTIIRDITSRRKSEEKVMQIHKQLVTLIQAIPDLVYFKDVKGRNLLFNKAFESFIGMDARQIAGKRDSEIMPGKLALQCRKSDQEVLTHKKTVRIEEYFALPGGEQQYFETIKSPIFDEQKKLNGLIGISRDINNRKKAEKELNFRLEYQKLLSRISTNFTKLRWNNIDDEIEDAIEHVCSFLKVEFGGIYMFSEDQSVVRIKYEWADPGIDLEKSRYLEWHTVRFPEIMSKISLHKTFYTSSPEELSPGLASVKKESEIDFKTLLVEPLFSGKNKLLGVLVFVQISHEKKWTEDEISFIQIFGEMVINLIERQQSEQQLGNIQAILKAAIEQSPAGIIIADAPDVRIRIANQAALGIRGETEDLLTKIPIQHHPERWKVYKEDGQLCSGEELPLSRAILNGEVCSDEEYIIRRESGEDRWVSANSAPIRNSEGKIVAGIVVFPDITERKRAESLLQVLNSASLAMQKAMTREEILKAIGNEFELLHFNCMIFLLDENEKFMNASLLSFGDTAIRKMERLLGMNQQEFSIPVQDLEIYRKVIVQRETVFIEDPEKELIHFLPGKTKKLTRRLIEILGLTRTIAAPLIISDRVVGAISVQSVNLMPSYIPAINAFAHQIAAAWHKANLMESLTDSMAELKHTQEQLIQAQKMEAVGKLAGGIAHDFNNLLTVIQGYSEILLNQLNKSDKAYYNVLQIEKAGRSAESLVRQLLAFGRKQIMNTKILNINNKLRDFQPMLERLIGESVELIILPASEIGNVKVDPNQLEQVIMNLVVNAKDAMPDGGTIIIETMNVTLPDEYAKQMYTEIYPGRYVLMTISDNGCGMDEDTQSQIFEPFFTTKVKGKGTGLGLSTVYGIIKQSGGYIVVKSQPNQGSTFRIYLPRVDTIKGKGFVDVSRKSDKERGYETILLVEDEKDVRSIIADTLRTRGYRVLEAPNGEVAIEMCKQNINSIDLILTDVVMPKIDGVVMVSRIQSLQPDIKVIYMSGYTDEEIIQHGILREGVHFLQKPFVPAFLLHKVRDVLDEYEE